MTLSPRFLLIAVTLIAANALGAAVSSVLSVHNTAALGDRQHDIEVIQSGTQITRVESADQRCSLTGNLAAFSGEMVTLIDARGVPSNLSGSVRRTAVRFRRDDDACNAIRNRYLAALSSAQVAEYRQRVAAQDP